jgi:hypothetical protein
VAAAALILLALLMVSACGHPTASRADAVGGSGRSAPRPSASQAEVPTTGPLRAPKTNPAQDGRYFTDLARTDPALANYVNSDGNAALRAMLTDGSAFCAFLSRGGGIDAAMADVVVGARSVEGQTHLPATVTTFNAIDAVALLDLCPGEQRLVPPVDRHHLHELAAYLSSGHSPANS